MASSLSVGSRLIIKIIKIYQYLISPLLGHCCRFNPTCSQYAIELICRFGLINGSWLITKRILKCHPLHTYIDIDTGGNGDKILPPPQEQKDQNNKNIKL